MRQTHVSFPRRVGAAPGTTTVQMQGAGVVEPVQPPMPLTPYPFVNPPRSTQSVYEPDPNSDNVRFVMPPNQWVTGPVEVRINVPHTQSSMGPVPNDLELANVRAGYQPYRKGWLSTVKDKIFNLQGSLGEMTPTEKWTVAAAILSSLAIATTATLAVMRYHEETLHR